jgi:hypothetical protein
VVLALFLFSPGEAALMPFHQRLSAATVLLSEISIGPAASGGRVNVSASTSSRRSGQRSISSRDPSGLAAIPDGIFGSTYLST